jgi:hypothetical protein
VVSILGGRFMEAFTKLGITTAILVGTLIAGLVASCISGANDDKDLYICTFAVAWVISSFIAICVSINAYV